MRLLLKFHGVRKPRQSPRTLQSVGAVGQRRVRNRVPPHTPFEVGGTELDLRPARLD